MSNLIQPAQLQSTAFVNSQVAANNNVADQGLSLVGNMAASKSANEAAVTLTNLNALAAGKLVSIQNGPLSNIGAVGGVAQEVWSVDFTGLMALAGGLSLNRGEAAVVHSASPYTILVTDCIVPVNTTGGAVTVDLPATAPAAGKVWIVKDEGGDAGTNHVTISAGGTTQIDGGTTATISSNYGVSRIYSNGSQYFTW